MKNRRLDRDLLPSQLKRLVAGMFRPDLVGPVSIADDEPLIGGRFGLDSLDALELDLCIEEEFGVATGGGVASRGRFNTIASLVRCIHGDRPIVRASAGRLGPLNFPRSEVFAWIGLDGLPAMAWR